MTDEFLTKGLENDRYLKALRLVQQFEDEVETILHEFDQRMVDAQPELFDSSTDPDAAGNQSPGSGLAHQRINHQMAGARAPDKDQRLNVHLYWMPPTEYGRRDIDSAVRAFGYKIKYADEGIDNRVVEQTRAGDWAVDTSGNPYDSNTVFYRHVSSAAEIEEAMEILVNHFSEFGDAYGVAPNEDS